MNIHPFGCGNLIPINPDNVPENETYGQGTERPIGLSYLEILKLIWTVRSFNCNFNTIVNTDPLSQFLLSGGASSTILEAVVGLNSIDMSENDNVTGYTSISTSFKQKERTGTRRGSQEQIKLYTWDGIQGGKLITKISLGNNQKLLYQNNKTIYEGNLIIGPIHSIAGKVIIDFSNIKFYKKLYWPRIILSSKSASSILFGPQMLGGISFVGGGLINMYSTSLNPLTTARIAFGNISIGKRCCDKFYYDDKDLERAESVLCPDCQKYKKQYENLN